MKTVYLLDRSPRDTMRELTPEELRSWYRLKQCPFCATGAAMFLPGPRGGASQNVECPKCEARINIVPNYVVDFGQVIREPSRQS